MAATELSDAEVFGSSQKELTDAEVFGKSSQPKELSDQDVGLAPISKPSAIEKPSSVMSFGELAGAHKELGAALASKLGMSTNSVSDALDELQASGLRASASATGMPPQQAKQAQEAAQKVELQPTKPGTASKAIAGALNAVNSQTAYTVTSPLALAAMLTGTRPVAAILGKAAPLINRVLSLAFGSQALAQSPQVAKNLIDAVGSKDPYNIAQSSADAAMTIMFGAAGAKYGLKGIARDVPVLNDALTKTVKDNYTPEQLKDIYTRVSIGQGTPQEQDLVKFINSESGKPAQVVKAGAEVTTTTPRIDYEPLNKFLGVDASKILTVTGEPTTEQGGQNAPTAVQQPIRLLGQRGGTLPIEQVEATGPTPEPGADIGNRVPNQTGEQTQGPVNAGEVAPQTPVANPVTKLMQGVDFANMKLASTVGVKAGLTLTPTEIPMVQAEQTRAKQDAANAIAKENDAGFQEAYGRQVWLSGVLEGINRKGPNYDAMQQTPRPESVTPAITYKKRVYHLAEGEENHNDIIARVKAELGIPKSKRLAGVKRGFILPDGTFSPDREKAAKIAQVPTTVEPGKLHSEDLVKAKSTIRSSDWRKSFDETPDIEQKIDWLRAVANKKSTPVDLADVLKRAEQLLGQQKHSRLANTLWDVARNPAASPETKTRALSLYEKFWEPEGSVEAKEPWQMTAAEYKKAVAERHGPKGQEDVLFLGNNDEAVSRAMHWFSEAKRLTGNRSGQEILAEPWGHKVIVQNALKEGKSVPPEVLADYPDLKPSPSVVKPEEPLKPSDIGYRSDKAFQRDYAKNGLKEHGETETEFMMRRHCGGGVPKTKMKAVE